MSGGNPDGFAGEVTKMGGGEGGINSMTTSQLLVATTTTIVAVLVGGHWVWSWYQSRQRNLPPPPRPPRDTSAIPFFRQDGKGDEQQQSKRQHDHDHQPRSCSVHLTARSRLLAELSPLPTDLTLQEEEEEEEEEETAEKQGMLAEEEDDDKKKKKKPNVEAEDENREVLEKTVELPLSSSCERNENDKLSFATASTPVASTSSSSSTEDENNTNNINNNTAQDGEEDKNDSALSFLSSSSKDGKSDKKKKNAITNAPSSSSSTTARTSNSQTQQQDKNDNNHIINNNNDDDIIVVPFVNSSNEHPGLDGFGYWCDVESSLFRIYNVGRNDGQDVIPPYVPKSRRGRIRVELCVTNESSRRIQIFWISYKGIEKSKGILKPRRRRSSSSSTTTAKEWKQMTWIEHPWIFRDADTGDVLLYFIPDRILPVTCLDSITINPTSTTTTRDEDDADAPPTAIHRFTIRDPPEPDNIIVDNPYLIAIDDPILPFPALHHITTIHQAVEWTIRHMLRVTEAASMFGSGGMLTNWDTILRYFYNILQNPSVPKYRRIRLANPIFASQIWNTPARGLFLAAGFVEQGSHAELGTCSTTQLQLPSHRYQELSQLVVTLEKWKQRWPSLTQGTIEQIQQPMGATDGSGRAGYGVAGSSTSNQFLF